MFIFRYFEAHNAAELFGPGFKRIMGHAVLAALSDIWHFLPLLFENFKDVLHLVQGFWLFGREIPAVYAFFDQ